MNCMKFGGWGGYRRLGLEGGLDKIELRIDGLRILLNWFFHAKKRAMIQNELKDAVVSKYEKRDIR